MGLIEAILLGIQFKRLQKPLVFFSMLIGFILFSIFGLSIVWAVVSGLVTTEKEITLQLLGASAGLAVFAFLFFGLAWVCGYFIKRCFQ
ncbi:hypothetical protein ACMXYO_09305 [Neptuniibacter sp. QD37_6]|uniref:hypothetical protein n=1 Tax=Neptuniibacter sp. QD37_6 TaxID=3398210 RepID=UPI0039F62CBA